MSFFFNALNNWRKAFDESAAASVNTLWISENAMNQARAHISDFAPTSTSPFTGISQSRFETDLLARLQYPNAWNQNELNVCGASTFGRVWLLHDTLGFVQSVMHLYYQGRVSYNGLLIEANEAMFAQTPNSYMNVVDWLIAASLQNSSGLLGYNPTMELGGLRGIALPYKVVEWFEKLPNIDLHTSSKDHDWLRMNTTLNSGGAVSWLVNINHLDDYFTDTAYRQEEQGFFGKAAAFLGSFTGNHYIGLDSRLQFEGDHFKFKVWTWGTSLEVLIPPAELEKAITKSIFVLPKNA